MGLCVCMYLCMCVCERERERASEEYRPRVKGETNRIQPGFVVVVTIVVLDLGRFHSHESCQGPTDDRKTTLQPLPLTCPHHTICLSLSPEIHVD